MTQLAILAKNDFAIEVLQDLIPSVKRGLNKKITEVGATDPNNTPYLDELNRQLNLVEKTTPHLIEVGKACYEVIREFDQSASLKTMWNAVSGRWNLHITSTPQVAEAMPCGGIMDNLHPDHEYYNLFWVTYHIR